MSMAAILPAAATLLSGVLDKLEGAEKQKAEIIIREMEIEAASVNAQHEVNRAEASSGSLFVAGWRPFIGWVCGVALGYEFIARPLGIWSVAVWMPGGPILPSIAGDGMLWELMFGMLGLAGLRSFEKTKRVAR